MNPKNTEHIKNSNGTVNYNKTVNQSQDNHNSDTSFCNHNYQPFDFGISQEFIEENKKSNVNLVRHRHKFAPFTSAERKERRNEVYKLHFEHGMPATRIAIMMKVDRNTINNDLKILYNRAIRDYNSDKSFDDIIEKNSY